MHRANSSNNTDAPPENASITGLKSPGPGSLHVTAKLNIIHFSEILMI